MIAQKFSDALEHITPVVGFLAGIVVARLLVTPETESSDTFSPSSRAGLCFLLASGLWTIVAVLTPSLGSLLIPVLAFGMGAQNASFTKLGRAATETSGAKNPAPQAYIITAREGK